MFARPLSSLSLATVITTRSLAHSIQPTCSILDSFVIRSNMSTSSKHTSITHECLSDLYKYWFEHAPTTRHAAEDANGEIKLPTESLKIWFQGSESVDKYCTENFKGAVEQAISTPVQDLISLGAKDPQGRDALALILLLDQMPRNIYRGKEAKIAYEKCDPKAQQLAKTFTSHPYNFDSREKCPTWWHQSFMYMPCECVEPPEHRYTFANDAPSVFRMSFDFTFRVPTCVVMHAESPELHELMLKKLQQAIDSCGSEGEKKAISQTKDFEEKHYNVIKRFGRYPSRNEALGRESTPEESEFLKNGPGWQ